MKIFDNPPPKRLERFAIYFSMAVILGMIALASTGAAFLIVINGG